MKYELQPAGARCKQHQVETCFEEQINLDSLNHESSNVDVAAPILVPAETVNKLLMHSGGRIPAERLDCGAWENAGGNTCGAQEANFISHGRAIRATYGGALSSEGKPSLRAFATGSELHFWYWLRERRKEKAGQGSLA